MQLVVDEKYISRREMIGRYAGIASIVIVAISFLILSSRFASTAAMFVLLSVVLVVAMIFSFVGGFYGERFGGPLAHYAGVQAALKGLDGRFTLFQYVLPAPHVLLGPGGLTVIVVRSHAGEITYDGQWSHRQRGRVFRELAGQERFGKPEKEVEQQVEQLRDFLDEHLPGADVPVRGVLYLVSPEVEVHVADPPVPVFYGKKLKSWLRGPGMRDPLPEDVAESLAILLAEAGPAVDVEEDEDE